jgi:hypothetical protein
MSSYKVVVVQTWSLELVRINCYLILIYIVYKVNGLVIPFTKINIVFWYKLKISNFNNMTSYLYNHEVSRIVISSTTYLRIKEQCQNLKLLESLTHYNWRIIVYEEDDQRFSCLYVVVII